MSLHDYYESGDVTGFIEKLDTMTLNQVYSDKCHITEMSILYKVINKKKNMLKHIANADIYCPRTCPEYKKRNFPYVIDEIFIRHPYDAVLCELLLAKGMDPNRGEYRNKWSYTFRLLPKSTAEYYDYFQLYENEQKYRTRKWYPLDWALGGFRHDGDVCIIQKLFEYGANYKLISTGNNKGGTPPGTRHLLDEHLLQSIETNCSPDILRVCIIHGVETNLETEYVHAATIQDGYELRMKNTTGDKNILRRNYEVYTSTKHDGISIDDRRDRTIKDTTRVTRELEKWWSSSEGIKMKNDIELKRLEDERAQARLEEDRRNRAINLEKERIEKERLEKERIERERIEKELAEENDIRRRVKETPQGLAYLTWVSRNLEFMDQFSDIIPDDFKTVLGKIVSNTLVQAGHSLTPEIRSQIKIPEEYRKIMDSEKVKEWWI